MNNIDELLRYDPIAEAEKITHKGHWSNFSDEDNMLALLLNMKHVENKEKVLKGNKDTYFSMSWNYLIEVLFDNGFKIGTEWEFIDALPKEMQRNITMGLATPYDYGYKAD